MGPEAEEVCMTIEEKTEALDKPWVSDLAWEEKTRSEVEQ
jgi:hypothetical protein